MVGISTAAAVALSYKCEYESAVALCIPDLPTGFFIAIFRCVTHSHIHFLWSEERKCRATPSQIDGGWYE